MIVKNAHIQPYTVLYEFIHMYLLEASNKTIRLYTHERTKKNPLTYSKCAQYRAYINCSINLYLNVCAVDI